MVHIVADVAYETALFGTEDIACAADVEVAHGNIEPAANGTKLFDGLKAFLSIVGEGAVGGNKHVAECLLVAATNAAAHLVEVAQSEVLGIVDNHCVGIGYIKAVFNDGGSNKNVNFTGKELHHCFLNLFSVHLAVCDGHAGIGY